MAKSNIILNLETLYEEMGNKWVNQNSLVINYAKGAKLAVGGSIAMAISNKKPHKLPGDFDFFTDDNEESLKFIQNIIFWLSQRKNTHYKIQFNTKTEFTLPGVSHHVRITVPFWKPICVMTLENPIRSFFYHGLKVQFFDDVVAAAKEATAKDNKDRLPFDVEATRVNIRTNSCPNCNLHREYCICVRPAVSVSPSGVGSSTSIADGTYDITCDSSNNTAEDIRNNQVNCEVTIRPRRADEVCTWCHRTLQVCSCLRPVRSPVRDSNVDGGIRPATNADGQNFYNSIVSEANRIAANRRNGPAIEIMTRDSSSCPNEVEGNNLIDWNFVAQEAARFHDAGIPTPCRPIPTRDSNRNIHADLARMEAEETAEIASEGEVRSLSERMRRDRDDALQANISILSNTMAYHPTRDSRDEGIVEFVDRMARARNSSRALERAETTGILTS